MGCGVWGARQRALCHTTYGINESLLIQIKKSLLHLLKKFREPLALYSFSRRGGRVLAELALSHPYHAVLLHVEHASVPVQLRQVEVGHLVRVQD